MNNIIQKLQTVDPAISVGPALCTATGCSVRYYDGTRATLHGADRHVPPVGGPYLPPSSDEYTRIELTVEALPIVDHDRREVVFPSDAVSRGVEEHVVSQETFGG